MNNEIVTILDLGTTKVCCFIVELFDDSYKIIGIGYSASSGIESGIIINMDDVQDSITSAIDEAEKQANFVVESVYVNISGKYIKSELVNIKGNINGRVITEEDIDEILNACMGYNEKRNVLHSIPIMYTVDSIPGIKDPVGMLANSINVDVNIITAPLTQLNNLLICMGRCHLDVMGVIASGYAAGLSVVEAYQEKNILVLDAGGGTISLAFFFKGILVGLYVIGIGGKQISADIAQKLNISFVNAERLKALHGASFVSLKDTHDMIFVPVIESEDVINLEQLSKSVLNQIIQDRVDKFCIEINKIISKSIFKNNFFDDIIFTGGASELTGFPAFVSCYFKKNSALKVHKEILDFIDIPSNSDFSVALGMIKFVQSERNNRNRHKNINYRNAEGSFVKKMFNWLEKYL